ncbi:MAG: hypothetical protein ACJ8GN_26330 [Longimicrobiaceae bacterium]
MKKKLSLELEALAVDSFETSAAAGGRGTVHGRDGDPEPTPPEYEADCTCYDSCLCPTNAYYCATVMATVISCDYTANGSCLYDTGATRVTCGGISCNRCPE